MRLDDKRFSWNAAASERLAAPRLALPGAVLTQAVARRWAPRTARAAVDGYWRAHPLRADRLARALAAKSAVPEGWRWRTPEIGGGGFRLPPLPFRAEGAEPGRCVVCGQPVYRFGWHQDRWNAGAPNSRAVWHACCVAAWKFWIAPHATRKLLARIQKQRCGLTGKRLLRTSEVDHRVPLHEVWRDRRDLPFPKLIGFWGADNLQVVNAPAHLEKSAHEASARARLRIGAPPPEMADAAGRAVAQGSLRLGPAASLTRPFNS